VPNCVPVAPADPPAKHPVFEKTIVELETLYVVLLFAPTNPVVLVPPVIVTVEVPSVSVFVFTLLKLKTAQVTFLLFELKEPFVNEILPVVINGLDNVHPPPTPLNPMFDAQLVPLKSTVLPVATAVKLVFPVYVRVKFVAGKRKLPYMLIEVVPAIVITPSTAVASKSKQFAVAVAKVTVKAAVPVFELASKNTLSTRVGTVAPLAPPDEADQLVVLVPFQVPVPPTQYLFAITQQGWGFHPRRIKLHRLYHACSLVVEPLLL